MTEQKNHIEGFQLQAYLDGVLDPAEVITIQDHLAGCPTCSQQVSRLEKLGARLNKLPEVSLSRDLSSLVVSRLKEEESLSPGITWTLVIEALAAGTVIAALLPALQATGWLPNLENIPLALIAAINLFLAQLASGWIVWWAGLKLQLSQWLASIYPLQGLPLGTLSPWILVGTAGGLVILMNALILGTHPQPNGNHNKAEI